MRKVSFIHYKTPQEIWMVCDTFDRGGFFDQYPENCSLRNGVFILYDQLRKTYSIIVCRNNNGLTIWQ